MPSVLALDLEGTLISNAVSQIPRPGLFSFLEEASRLFPRIVIFTAVREATFRSVAQGLVDSGDAPAWFADLEYVNWHGTAKDLRFIKDACIEDIVLVDDFEGYVMAEQKQHWIAIKSYENPYGTDDRELLLTLEELRVLWQN